MISLPFTKGLKKAFSIVNYRPFSQHYTKIFLSKMKLEFLCFLRVVSSQEKKLVFRFNYLLESSNPLHCLHPLQTEKFLKAELTFALNEPKSDGQVKHIIQGISI